MTNSLTFHTAAEHGHLHILKYLVERGAIPDRDDMNWSLRWSARYGHFDVVKYLVQLGANIDDMEVI